MSLPEKDNLFLGLPTLECKCEIVSSVNYFDIRSSKVRWGLCYNVSICIYFMLYILTYKYLHLNEFNKVIFISLEFPHCFVPVSESGSANKIFSDPNNFPLNCLRSRLIWFSGSWFCENTERISEIEWIKQMLLLIWGQFLMLIYGIYNGISYGRCLRWLDYRKAHSEIKGFSLRNLIKRKYVLYENLDFYFIVPGPLWLEAYQDYVFYECKLQAHVVLLPMWPT